SNGAAVSPRRWPAHVFSAGTLFSGRLAWSYVATLPFGPHHFLPEEDGHERTTQDVPGAGAWPRPAPGSALRAGARRADPRRPGGVRFADIPADASAGPGSGAEGRRQGVGPDDQSRRGGEEVPRRAR